MILILWEAVFRLQIWPPYLFPGPLEVLNTFWKGILDQTLILALSASMNRLLIGYFIAILIGVTLGIFLARFTLLADTLGKAIMALQTIPSIAWLPFAILWFGIGDLAIIFVVALGATWTMTLSMESGLRGVQPIYISAGKMMGLSSFQLFTKVMIPATIPQMITGMRVAWAFAWRALLAGELIGSGTGLGQILMVGRSLGDMSLVLSIIIIIAIQGYLIDNLFFKKLEHKALIRWGLKQDDGEKTKPVSTKKKKWMIASVGAIAIIILFLGVYPTAKEKETVKIGFLPNITHAPALVGIETGMFEKELDSLTLHAQHFDAGPALMEAFSTGKIDLAYVGPGPAILNHIKTSEAIMIAGSTEGGSVLLVSPDSQVNSVKDLSGKKIAVPQLGNTQDIQLRHLLHQQGLEDIKKGGTVEVLQSPPADMVTLFAQQQIDAAIVPEPWGSQLAKKVGAKILVDSQDIWKNGAYPTTILIVRKSYAEQNPAVIEDFVKAHNSVIDYISSHPEESKQAINQQLIKRVNKELPADVLNSSFARVKFTSTINQQTILEFAELTAQAGYIQQPFDLNDFFQDRFLQK